MGQNSSWSTVIDTPYQLPLETNNSYLETNNPTKVPAARQSGTPITIILSFTPSGECIRVRQTVHRPYVTASGRWDLFLLYLPSQKVPSMYSRTFWGNPGLPRHQL
ncbi:hypothetical protein H6P81_010661 [Aristolochia fimbriata]|uniref:Uncharacterized protein n=1 Tax=Aristolochia fimbriata TaxID=158543 RepID=A0AAV7EQJ0_ARIFI|nr:hypothetical protein H6P81_010661 [Aristolochia fimbriata]